MQFEQILDTYSDEFVLVCRVPCLRPRMDTSPYFWLFARNLIVGGRQTISLVLYCVRRGCIRSDVFVNNIPGDEIIYVNLYMKLKVDFKINK